MFKVVYLNMEFWL